MYRIREVKTRRDLMRFIKFPDRLYKDCPQYVPALYSDQVKSLTKVSTLSYCSHAMWLVEECPDVAARGKVVGRISAAVNPRYNERYGTRRARFGWFDTIDSAEVAGMLIHTAEDWARAQGMDEMHGPLYYNTLGKQGMLVEGFENTPPFNCIYNYPYYNTLLADLGYAKECDWVQYLMPFDQPLPEKTTRLAGLLKERYNLHEGSINALKKDKQQVHDFFRTYSDAFSERVYNFIPFTDEEIEEEAKGTLGFVSDKMSTILVDQDGEIAAFGISFPSISEALKKARGRLFPFGWIHLLKAMRRYETVDLMINGAAPRWQGKGVSSIYFVDMAAKARKAGCKYAISNPQIETNSAVNIWNSYERAPFMRRRCYLKKI